MFFLSLDYTSLIGSSHQNPTVYSKIVLSGINFKSTFTIMELQLKACVGNGTNRIPDASAADRIAVPP